MMIKEKSVSPSNMDSLSRLKLRKEKMNRQRSSNNNNNSIDENDPRTRSSPAADTTTTMSSPCSAVIVSTANIVPNMHPLAAAYQQHEHRKLQQQTHEAEIHAFEPSITSTPGNNNNHNRNHQPHPVLNSNSSNSTSNSSSIITINHHCDPGKQMMLQNLHQQHHSCETSRVMSPATSGNSLASAAAILTTTSPTSSLSLTVAELRKTQSSDALLCSNFSVSAPKVTAEADETAAASAKKAKSCDTSANITLNVHEVTNGSNSSSSSNSPDRRDEEKASAGGANIMRGFTKWRGANLMNDGLDGHHHHPGRDGVEQDSGFGDCTPKTTLEKPLRLSVLKHQGYDVPDATDATDGQQQLQNQNEVVVVASAMTRLSPAATPVIPVSPSHVPLVIENKDPEFMEITFEKGWASRLGIQLVDDISGKEPKACIVKQIVPNTIASQDGRVKVGYKILKVNDFDLINKEAKYVIDLLRKMKGKICMKFLIQ